MVKCLAALTILSFIHYVLKSRIFSGVFNLIAGLLCTGPSETFQCVCQVFYHKEGLNWWKIKFAFCPKEYLDVSRIPVIMIIIVYVDIGAGYENILQPECMHW